MSRVNGYCVIIEEVVNMLGFEKSFEEILYNLPDDEDIRKMLDKLSEDKA